MRIITGSARGAKLLTLEGLETRPTAERTKEAVFSMIRFELENRKILDLFSGSGQMALEALSQGAESAVLLDKSKEAVNIITKNAEKTRLKDKCKIYCTDAFDYLKRNKGEKFDIVFVDPPYALKLVEKSLNALIENDNLKPTSIIICESAEPDIFDPESSLKDKFETLKKSKYGVAYVNILTPNGGM